MPAAYSSREFPALLASELEPLRIYFEDDQVTEIMANADGSVWIESAGTIHKSDKKLSEASRNIILKRTAGLQDKDCVRGELSSIINTVIDGMRISGGLMPLSRDGSFFSIRKHLPSHLRPSLETLVEWRMLTASQAEIIVDLVITQKLNCLVVGSTSSGKTTVANAILGKLPSHERVFCIEDAPELHIVVPNKNCLTTDGDKGLTARELVKLAMRQRPDRLILGETRGDESFDLVRAMNSGHDGTVSTIHASSAAMGLEALEMLYQMSLPTGASISTEIAQKYIASGVKALIFAARRYHTLPDGGQKSIRRVEEICLVKGVLNENYVLEYL